MVCSNQPELTPDCSRSTSSLTEISRKFSISVAGRFVSFLMRRSRVMNQLRGSVTLCRTKSFLTRTMAPQRKSMASHSTLISIGTLSVKRCLLIKYATGAAGYKQYHLLDKTQSRWDESLVGALKEAHHFIDNAGAPTTIEFPSILW